MCSWFQYIFDKNKYITLKTPVVVIRSIRTDFDRCLSSTYFSPDETLKITPTPHPDPTLRGKHLCPNIPNLEGDFCFLSRVPVEWSNGSTSLVFLPYCHSPLPGILKSCISQLLNSFLL